MKFSRLALVYLLALVGELVAVAAGLSSLQYFFKPLLMLLLIWYFIEGAGRGTTRINGWIIAALAFSWAGDVLLMFQSRESIFFLLGLSAFLLAHIFYIIFFHRVKTVEVLRSQAWTLVIAVIYYLALMMLLSGYLGDMKVPVRIYGLVICFMWMLAMHMLYLKNRPAGRLMAVGALLFVISDSVLAVNKFYQSFEMAGFVIMFTYGLAQLLITTGAMQYLRKS